MNFKELKPCPFCGSEAILITSSTIYWNNYSVVCDGAKDGDCAGLGGSATCETEEDAIFSWNCRTTE